MVAAEAKPLAGLRVLVTRPAHQALALSCMIEARGGIAIRFPTIEIAPPSDPQALKNAVARLELFDLAIFVSPNAVTYAFATMDADGLPSGLRVACVGAGSARALAEHGVIDAMVPARSDSEGLLELPSLRNVQGKRVAIFRGEGGRELLSEQLRSRGADVTYIECYRRVRPQADSAALARDVLQNGVDVVTATSADALRNLFDMIEAPAAALLARAPLVVVSERLRDIAHELGQHGPVLVATSASDDGIVEAIRAWRVSQKNL
jgi:uroporphyrinogen-III synthase